MLGRTVPSVRMRRIALGTPDNYTEVGIPRAEG